jgi:hypothetical protein
MSDGGAGTIDLRYRPGAVEYTGVAVSAAAIIAWLLVTWSSGRAAKREAKRGWDDSDPRRSPR